jgi:hypothetical protein
MHPLAGSFENLKDSEIEEKITDLTKKYFMTSNIEVQMQISSLLENYKEEIGKRRQLQLQRLMQKSEKSLDSLVKVN